MNYEKLSQYSTEELEKISIMVNYLLTSRHLNDLEKENTDESVDDYFLSNISGFNFENKIGYVSSTDDDENFIVNNYFFPSNTLIKDVEKIYNFY